MTPDDVRFNSQRSAGVSSTLVQTQGTWVFQLFQIPAEGSRLFDHDDHREREDLPDSFKSQRRAGVSSTPRRFVSQDR